MKKGGVAALLIAGAGAGFLNGFFGGGGGMLIVPVLAKAGGLGVKKAHAGALAVILPMTVVSAVTYHLSGEFFAPEYLSVAAGAAAGGLLGAKLLGKLNEKVVGLVFSLIMAAAGVRAAFG